MLASDEVVLHEDLVLITQQSSGSDLAAEEAATRPGVCDVLRAAALKAVGLSEEAGAPCKRI